MQILFVLIGILEFLAILPALFIALMGAMLFDAPGSESNLINYLLILGPMSYPLFAIFGIWKAFPMKSRLPARPVWLLLPLISLIILGIAWLASDYFCGGKTVC